MLYFLHVTFYYTEYFKRLLKKLSLRIQKELKEFEFIRRIKIERKFKEFEPEIECTQMSDPASVRFFEFL